MTARIIDGKLIASELRARVAAEVARVSRENALTPGLAVVLVGSDPASQVYVRSKHKQTQGAGMASFEHVLPADIAQGSPGMVAFGGVRGLAMTGGDRGLELIRPGLLTAQCGLQQPDALGDLRGVPARSVLILQADEFAVVVEPRPAPGVLDQHEREQSGDDPIDFVRLRLAEPAARVTITWQR